MPTGVTVDFNANLARWSSAIDKATDDLNKFKTNTSRIAGNIKSILAGLGAGLSVGGMAMLVKDMADYQDEMGKLAQKTGIAVESISTLKYVGELSGASIEQLSTGIKGLTNSMFQAGRGSKEFADVFKAIGVDVKNADGSLRSSEQVMLDIADKFAGLEDGTTKSALAMKLFGESGLAMIPMLNQGADAIRRGQDAARGFGLEVSAGAAAAAEEFNDNMARLKANVDGLANSIGNNLIPELNKMIKPFVATEALPLEDQIFRAQIAVSTIRRRLATEKGSGALHRWMFGTKDELNAELEKAKQNLADLQKQLADKQEKPKPSGAAGLGNLGGDDSALSKYIKTLNDADDKTLSYTEKLQALYGEWDKGAIGVSTYRAELKKLADEQQRLSDQDGGPKTDKRQLAMNSYADSLRAAQLEADLFFDKQDALDQLMQDGSISSAVYSQELERLSGTFGGLADSGVDDMQRLIDAVHGWGREFTDTLADSVMTGKLEFSDLADSIVRDLLRIQIQKNITDPFVQAAGSMNWGSMFGFADGGIMSASGPLPLKKYASGGIANSPQLALYGEGSMNEAFVPLPDGRSIPVTMKGGGGGNVRVVIENRGTPMEATDAGVTFDAEGTIVRVVLDDVRRGGPVSSGMARAFGLQRQGGFS